MTEFSSETIMAAGYKRIKSIADRHGINSPEVLSACERWGGILDDVNFPDTTCRWCGHAVTHAWEGQKPGEGTWYHIDTKSKHCASVAAAEATPLTEAERDQAAVRLKPMGTTTGRMSNTSPDLSTIPGKHPITKKPYIPRPNQTLVMGPDELKQAAENIREKAFSDSFKPQGLIPNYNAAGQRMIGDNPQA